MTKSKTTLVGAVALVAMLGLGACATGTAVPTDAGGEVAPEMSESGSSGEGGVDADGFAIPGEVLQLEIGDSVTYYSMPELTKDDAQKVTIHSVEYIDKADVEAGAPLEEIDEGVIVVSLTWEQVIGSVQSNTAYLKPKLDSGEDDTTYLFYRSDKMKNGRVDADTPKTGTFTMAISRGATTLTLEDYRGVPVAEYRVDTSA